jgi:3-hydroxyacyl-CoA dehydrogenase
LGRCLLPVMNDGVVILVEGIATCASDIEVDRVYGFGSRRYRDGSMLYERGVGWDTPS